MKIIHSDNAPAALGPYSQAYEANGFVFTAGELGIDPQTGKLPEGIAAQAEQACKNSGSFRTVHDECHQNNLLPRRHG